MRLSCGPSSPVLPGAALLLVLAALTAPEAAPAQPRRDRDFDARSRYNVGFVAQPEPAQRAAERALAREVPGLAVAFDRVHGVARKVHSHTDYLTAPRPGVPARDLALEFARRHRVLLGLTAEDLADFEITDEVLSGVSGATHLYLRQRFAGLPVYNGQLHANVNRQGRILSLNNAFVRDLARSIDTHRPQIGAAEAVLAAAEHLGLEPGGPPTVISSEPAGQQTTRLAYPGLSGDEITARLFWLPVRLGETRLVWNFQIQTLDGEHWFDLNVDAVTGEVWTRFDWVTASEQYTVYPIPVESPQHTVPLPPADARMLVVSPADPTTSPLGWHDDGATAYTITQGNNVHACEDRDHDYACSVETDCGVDLHCDFPLDLTLEPDGYIDAAVTNLFYWNNIVHDVQLRYGFDEPSGNFQETNFNPLGLGAGSDSVNALAQFGGDSPPFYRCNAFFATPVDGSNPTMRMYLCNHSTPEHDGDLDAGVIVHEYGHGISRRQVGGPSNVSCLNNLQQPGEGWSDWLGLVYTAETGDQGTDPRGLGSYLFNLPPDGTIRPQQYSTDPAINDYTYETIGSGVPVPHGVGSVWAQALWEVFWALVAQHGFQGELAAFDVASFATAAGNQRALLYVNEGLKNTACGPTFLDARDGIIQAVIDFDSGDLCTVWQAFADFGLGVDATTAGPGSLVATNGFQVPVACVPDFAGPDRDICLGETVTLGVADLPTVNTTYLWSTGETTPQITVTPAVTTTYTVTATDPFGVHPDSVTVTVDPDCRCGLDERFEGEVSGWTATGLWHLVDNSVCAAPENGYFSPTHAFYYGQEASCNYQTGTNANAGTLTSPILVGIKSTSTLSFRYLREVESYPYPYDLTEVDIVTESGSTTVFSLDSTDPSNPVWTSSGSISLGAFAGQKIRVRFRFETRDGAYNDFIGWMVDDVVVTSAKATNITFDGGSASGWSNDSVASDCTTGTFIVGTPDLMVTFGTITQPDGDAGSGAGKAFYTAANTSPDIDDVDLGKCVANSPTYQVSEPSVVSISAFHGQRTAGNDPTGDYFDLEMSIGGGPWQPLLAYGDENVDARWTSRGRAVGMSGSTNVRFRVTASDAAGPGDTLEGGVDNIMICPFDGTVPVQPDPCIAQASTLGGALLIQQPKCPIPKEETGSE